jgi:hypothetical protein
MQKDTKIAKKKIGEKKEKKSSLDAVVCMWRRSSASPDVQKPVYIRHSYYYLLVHAALSY